MHQNVYHVLALKSQKDQITKQKKRLVSPKLTR